ncbi:MAG TPA: hypothetical protein VI968_04465 [archaeon]|nr:hypothetical protein [archaeon]
MPLYIPAWREEQLGSARRVSIFSYVIKPNTEPERLKRGQHMYDHEISCYVKSGNGRVERESAFITIGDRRKAHAEMERMLKRRITEKYPSQ